MPEDEIADVPPNHLSIDPHSPFYSEEVLRRDVGIRFNGVEKTNVHEYNVAEGWVRNDEISAELSVDGPKGSVSSSGASAPQSHVVSGRKIVRVVVTP